MFRAREHTQTPGGRGDAHDQAARPSQVDQVTHAILALQRNAGNRAVGQLLRQPQRSPARKPTATDTVSLTVIPVRAMNADEFAAFVTARLLGIDEAEAAGRRDELSSSDPHLTAGVTRAEVGKPITLDVKLPALGGSEVEDTTAREAEFGALDDSERKAINAEADRRYWDKRGLPAHTDVVEPADQELWKRTRDEVVRDRNRLDALPAEVRAIVMPGDARPAPAQYADALRLGHTLEAFTWEDWALFERRVGAVSGGLPGRETAVDAFTRGRARERKIIERVRGTEAVYDLVLRFNVARSMGMKPDQYKRFPHYQPMLDHLRAAGFQGVWDYENATSKYLLLFEERAVEIANLALAASERIVRSEIARHSDTHLLDRTFADFATLRALVDEYHVAMQEVGSGAGAGANAPLPTLDAAEAERKRLTARYPSLADPGIDTEALNTDSPAALGAVLVKNARARLENIEDTRKKIAKKPESALFLDRVLGLTRQELGADDGSVGWRIVKQRMDDIGNQERWNALGIALLAIGVAALTFGEGTPVVLGYAGSLAIGGYQAYDEWERYEAGLAAAHTSLDPAQSLSSRDPTIAWFAFALIGMGLDAAMLTKTLTAAKPAIQALETGGDVAKFSSVLATARELTPGMRAALTRAAAARRGFKDAVKDLSAAWDAALKASGKAFTGGGDPTILAHITKVAFYAARVGIRRFEVFLQDLRAERVVLQGIDVDALTPEALAEWKKAFRQGVSEFDATRPTVKVPFRSGTRTVTFAEEMLIDGKRVGQRARNDIIKQLGLAHTDRGHGALRDARTLANEALQNATKAGAAGMSAQWASDEAMLANVAIARARAAQGLAVRTPTGKWIVDFEVTPDVGRVYVANSHLPPGATVRNAAPFATLPVSEIAPTHVRAVFDLDGGVYTIDSIFPAYLP